MISAKITRFFFDRAYVLRQVDEGTRRALAQIGGFVMQTARRSMRKSSKRNKYARSGGPPRTHNNPLLRTMLFFAYDPSSKSVVVGPEGFRGSQVPRLMEDGGVVVRNRNGVTTTMRYAPHPYMGPALDKTKQTGRFPEAFKGSIRSR